MTFTTFRVQGDVEPGFRDRFVEAIRRDAFQPLNVEDEAEESFGWCTIDRPFDTDLAHEKIFYNTYLNVGLRMDRWRIPAPLFKAFFADAARQHLAKTGRDKLMRREKEELKAVVTATLRRQLIPTMKVVDLSWNLETGLLRFWNNSTRIHEILEELFESTFNLRLVRNNPYIIAEQIGLSQGKLDALIQLEPTPFHCRTMPLPANRDEARALAAAGE
jgi:hypothetical protein